MIIILTLGRSGSSLIMQILKELGVPVIGQPFGVKADSRLQALHEELNPRGYYEQPEIFYGGPPSDIFQAIVNSGDHDVACKMDARLFADREQWPYWQEVAAVISAIILSYREPSEQAHSEFISSVDPSSHGDARTKFQFISKFLKDYAEIYGSFEKVLDSELSTLRSKVHLLNRAAALDPHTYVKRLCHCANIEPSEARLHSATANIEQALFRINRSALDPEEIRWASQLGAQAAYSKLEKDAAKTNCLEYPGNL